MSALSLVDIEEPEAQPERQPLFQVRVLDSPHPKDRARIARSKSTGRSWAYTPKATLEAAYRIREAIIEKYGEPGEETYQPPPGPVFIRFTAWVKMPVDIPKYKRATILPTRQNADLPNLEMLLADALTGFGYVDDAQIVDSRGRKRYVGTYGGPPFPCWELEIFEANPALDDW